MDKPSTVKVTILEKEYRVACPEDSRQELESAARFLDEKMREIKASGRVFGLDRIAVMAALNLAHGHLLQQNEHQANIERVKRMNARLDANLSLACTDIRAEQRTIETCRSSLSSLDTADQPLER